MKYVTYESDGLEHPGLLTAAGVVNADTLLTGAGLPAAGSLTGLIRRLADGSIPAGFFSCPMPAGCGALPLTAVRLLAPIPRPARNIFCLGKNYAKHAVEVKMTRLSGTGVPQYPIYFTKTANPAVPDGGTVHFSPRLTRCLDYEAELAFVIGREGRHIDPARAEDYIFGYTILNDISARDVQARHEQWFKGKNFDTFCPMGPYLVGREEIPFPVELDITGRVNGEVRQHDNTRHFIFDIPTILADLSEGLTLEPGDIISTGTPAGVGAGFDPPRFLKDGDTVECEIDKIGSLRVTIKAD